MRGSVNVPGATVVAEHTPTGITKTTTTGSSGSFSLSFLPIGGPYTVKVSAPGYNSESIDGLYLSLGDPLSFGVTLTSSSAADEIVVTAKPAEAFKMGTSTLLTRDQMDAVPTINRSVADFPKWIQEFLLTVVLVVMQKSVSWEQIQNSMTLQLTV